MLYRARLAALAALMAPTISLHAQIVYDGDNTPAGARHIPVEQSISGTFEPTIAPNTPENGWGEWHDTDYLVFDAVAGHEYFAATSDRVTFELNRGTAWILGYADIPDPRPFNYPIDYGQSFIAPVDGRVLLRIDSYVNPLEEPLPYHLRIQDRGLVTDDIPDFPAAAPLWPLNAFLPMVVGRNSNRRGPWTGDVDCFAVDLLPGHRYGLRFQGTTPDACAGINSYTPGFPAIVAPDGLTVLGAAWGTTPPNTTECNIFTVPVTGRYFVGIPTARYQFPFPTPYQVGLFDTGAVADDHPSTAYENPPLPDVPSQTVQAVSDFVGDSDAFVIRVPPNGSFRVVPATAVPRGLAVTVDPIEVRDLSTVPIVDGYWGSALADWLAPGSPVLTGLNNYSVPISPSGLYVIRTWMTGVRAARDWNYYLTLGTLGLRIEIQPDPMDMPDDAPDVPSEALPLALNQQVFVARNHSEDRDCFRISLVGGRGYSFSGFAHLVDPKGLFIPLVPDQWSNIQFIAPSTGDYTAVAIPTPRAHIYYNEAPWLTPTAPPIAPQPSSVASLIPGAAPLTRTVTAGNFSENILLRIEPGDFYSLRLQGPNGLTCNTVTGGCSYFTLAHPLSAWPPYSRSQTDGQLYLAPSPGDRPYLLLNMRRNNTVLPTPATYTLTLTRQFTRHPADDEPDDIAHALPLTLGVPVSAFRESTADVDMFTFHALSGHVYSGAGKLLNAQGQTIFYSVFGARWRAPADQTVFLPTGSSGAACDVGPYAFTVVDEGYVPDEYPDIMEGEPVFALGASVVGTIGYSDDIDRFRLRVPAGVAEFGFRVTSSAGPAGVAPALTTSSYNNGSTTPTASGYTYYYTDFPAPHDRDVPVSIWRGSSVPSSAYPISYTIEIIQPCPADINFDGYADNNDLIAYINMFFNHNLDADVGESPGIPGTDNKLDQYDFTAYLDAFYNCP